MRKKAAPAYTKKTSSRTRLGIAAVVFLVLVLLIGKLFGFIQSLYEPLNADVSLPKRSYAWKKDFNLNVVVKGDGTALLSYNPTEKKVTIIPIPDKILIDVPGGFGKYTIGSVYTLGQSQTPPEGPKLLKLSVTSLFGLPVDGFIDITSLKNANTPDKFVKFSRDEFLGFASATSSLKSDLTLMEVWDLKMAIAGARFDKVETWDLNDLNVLTSGKSDQGAPVLVPNINNVDNLVQKLAEGVFTADRTNVSVFNATEYPGLAQKGARIIGNLGGNVVMVTNAVVPQKKTYIAIKDSPNPQVVQKISQAFDLGCSGAPNCSILVCNLAGGKNACPTDDIEVTHSRTEVTVVLGEDFYQTYK